MSNQQSYSFVMSFSVRNQISQTLGRYPAERGGILGTSEGVICRFHYDTDGSCSSNAYHPDIRRLNGILEEWGKEDISFCGIIHSHHPSAGVLSSRDVEFGRAVLRENPHLKVVFFPLVFSAADNAEFQIIPFVIDANSVFNASIKFSNRI